MPRSVSVPAKPDKKLLAMKFVRPTGTKQTGSDGDHQNGAEGDKPKEENGTEKMETDNPSEKEPAKSNDDFRKMMLGSK